jgi:hypothetical protein
MFRNIFIALLLFISQNLSANWDNYAGEQLVLFSLAPGNNDQFARSCEEQKLPHYFQKIADQYPDIKAKIIAIDPCFSQDPAAPEYAFLKDWENEGLVFRKNNIEIEFFPEYIPKNDEIYSQRVEKYITKIIENGGTVFIGHHMKAYETFEPFRTAYNNLNQNNVQMYICCADLAPYSSPTVFYQTMCCEDELKIFFNTIIDPHLQEFDAVIDLHKSEFLDLELIDYERLGLEIKYTANGEAYFDQFEFEQAVAGEACYELLNTLIQNVSPSFHIYRDMLDLPFEATRSEDGSLQITL